MTDPVITRLEEIFKLANDGLSRKEFISAFEEVVKFTEKLAKSNASEFEALHKAFETLAAKVKKDANIDMSYLKKECEDMMSNMMKEHQSTINYVYDKVRGLKNGKDGKDGKDGISPKISDIVPEVISALPEDPEETGDEIITKINEAESQITKESVEGLSTIEENIKELQLRPTGKGGAKGIGLYVGGSKKLLTAQMINLIAGTGISISYNFTSGRNDITISATGSGAFSVLTATGTVNNSNVTFTFVSTPTLVIVNGASYRNGAGCTISGTTVTLDNAVGTGGDIYGLG